LKEHSMERKQKGDTNDGFCGISLRNLRGNTLR
jgi:hypothetical protein